VENESQSKLSALLAKRLSKIYIHALFNATPLAAVGGFIAIVFAIGLRRDKQLVAKLLCVFPRCHTEPIEVLAKGDNTNCFFNATLAQLVEQRIRNA
jgi:hypothetical protein